MGNSPFYAPRKFRTRGATSKRRHNAIKITDLKSVSKIPSYADPSFFNFKNGEKMKHPNPYIVTENDPFGLNSISSLSRFGSGGIPVDGVGRISYDHCFDRASPFGLITCILFWLSIFLHFILYLIFVRYFGLGTLSNACSKLFRTIKITFVIF